MQQKKSWFLLSMLGFGYAFLYIPITLLILYSFNASKLVTVWGGFSLKWYHQLFTDPTVLDSAWVSLRIAVVAATIALVLGTIIAFALVRFGRFMGRTLLTGMTVAPLVMPEVVIGCSIMLMYVFMGVQKGVWTIMIAHATFCIAYVAIVVQSRLLSFDQSLEEASMDLGATPVKTFFKVTLPIIAPAMLSGWLLAFTLSLDDLVIANFTSGPEATTLPMRIYSQIRLGVTPEINALSTLMIAFVTIGVLLASVFNKRVKSRS